MILMVNGCWSCRFNVTRCAMFLMCMVSLHAWCWRMECEDHTAPQVDIFTFTYGCADCVWKLSHCPVDVFGAMYKVTLAELWDTYQHFLSRRKVLVETPKDTSYAFCSNSGLADRNWHLKPDFVSVCAMQHLRLLWPVLMADPASVRLQRHCCHASEYMTSSWR